MRPWRCRVRGWLSRQGGLARCPRPLPAAARVRGAGGSAIRPRSLSAASLAAPPAASAQPGPAAHAGQGPQPPPAAGGGAPHAPRSRRTPRPESPRCARRFCLRNGSLPQPRRRAGMRALLEHEGNPTDCSHQRKGKAKVRGRGVSSIDRKRRISPFFPPSVQPQRTKVLATGSR